MPLIERMHFSDLSIRVEKEFRDHKEKYIFQAVIFIIAGIISALLPSIMALNITVLLGMVLCGTGIFQFILTARAHRHKAPLLSSLLSIIVGMLMLWKPLGVLVAVVTLLAVFLTLEGLLELLIAFEWYPLPFWGWMLFSGLVTLILAAVLWMGFPTLGIVYLGWIIAINLLLYGFSLLALVWKISA